MPGVASPVMGTAPDDRQSTPLSDLEQVVEDTAAVLAKQGVPYTVALARIADAAAMGAIVAARGGSGHITWLLAVGDTARSRLVSLTPSNDAHTGDEHADGTGSRPGGPA